MMRQTIYTALLLLSFICSAGAQDFTDSNLPIFIINTDNGAQIPDDPRVLATLKIINRGPGQRNYLDDQDNPLYLDYNGRIDIEIRGSSSQATPKKQYGFSTKNADNITNNNVSLLGMPDEHDWILNGMVFDPALMRDYLCFNLSRQIGEYASRTNYCEVVINGSYKGLYLLQEKIKVDDRRVDIVEIDQNDNSFPQVTGGYITKADKTTGGDPVAWIMVDQNGNSVEYIHADPEPDEVTTAQNLYIQSQFTKLAETASNHNISLADGYPSVIDVPSFIDHMIISELSSNSDSYQYSTFFHKDRNGKLRAGPLWDNDLTFSNDLFMWGLDRSKTDIWQFSNGDNEGSKFWKDLYYDDRFKCQFSKRWNELIQTGKPLNPSALDAYIDQTAAYINEAVERDNALWENTGDFQQRIASIKTFLSLRIPWITDNLGSYVLCSDPVLPPLVITKIMFHPLTSIDFPVQDDLEYIEITNNGDQTEDLTGIYFAGTGLVYQFPPNTSIGPYSSIILASNHQIFRLRYGFSPFGEFTRHLSNQGQNIILSDGFGNIIDNVSYQDTVPWPEADGNGYYLKLIDTGLDNNDPSSWIASNDVITSSEYPDPLAEVLVYPNPVSEILFIEAGFEMKTIILADLYGRPVKIIKLNDLNCYVDMRSLSEGIYFLRIESVNKIIIRKIIKK